MPPSRKRASSPVEVSDDKPAKKARTTTAKSKKASKDVGACSLTKKEIGDRVKSSLALEKYAWPTTVDIENADRRSRYGIPRMRIDMKMDTAFFRSFFIDNNALDSPLAVSPADFDAASPVVVVELNHGQAGELLGVSKVKGGNRYSTTYLAAMCAVFRPRDERCTLWLTV
ncbi:hypothetical protein LTR37_004936 [Vermiconidia calcicola]|uniref:Uncharacterized protein n=1 Tax=Vermiconidia calcicola TaxID=1690605 RepID=A0ACC3NKM8_9PEZI|nr:hypothetical protein LTR37_004936 [Vermiconidia calcicola]